jgi:transcription-repair coupling factor (superfamily II helicase)
MIPAEVTRLLNIMRLRITAKKLRIASIQESNGWVNVVFSPETMIEPKDIFSLKKKRDGKMRFLPEGFQIDTRGLSFEELYEGLSAIMTELAHSPSLHV